MVCIVNLRLLICLDGVFIRQAVQLNTKEEVLVDQAENGRRQLLLLLNGAKSLGHIDGICAWQDSIFVC